VYFSATAAALAQPDHLGIADARRDSQLVGLAHSFRATGPALSH